MQMLRWLRRKCSRLLRTSEPGTRHSLRGRLGSSTLYACWHKRIGRILVNIGKARGA